MTEATIDRVQLYLKGQLYKHAGDIHLKETGSKIVMVKIGRLDEVSLDFLNLMKQNLSHGSLHMDTVYIYVQLKNAHTCRPCPC